MHIKAKDFFKDGNGNVVLWQTPNFLLWGWIVFKVASKLLENGHLKTGFAQLSTATLFAWATNEAAKGVNYLRKLLGIIVLIVIVTGFFR